MRTSRDGPPARAARRLGAGLAAGAAACVLLTGCWGARFVRMPSYTEETRADVMDLTARNEALLKKLEAMERRLEEQSDLLRSLRAESASEMASLRERIDTLEQALGFGPEGAGRVRREPPAPPAGAESAGAMGARADSAAEGPGADPRAEYDAAYLQLLKGDYDLAIAGFTEFIARYPESALADNAQYWIGESHLARGEIAEAIEALVGVESRWPDSDKVPDALFKIAQCHQEERHFGAARRAYEDLVARFPNSEKARLARERLATLPAGE